MSHYWTWFTVLAVLLFAVLWVDQKSPSGTHSLRYLFSLLSEPLPGVPQYSVVGYVDDVLFISYTSESSRPGPRAPWMEKITDQEPQYWEESRDTFEEVKKKMSDTLRELMEQNTQTVGLHVFQGMLGCELREDGSVNWFERLAYDGTNYTANLDPATANEDGGNSEQSNECKKSLEKLLKYGEESLRRRVAPQTMVSRRKTGAGSFLIGYAYGFYPSEIEVKWIRNGVEIPWVSRELLPNPDGTYQVRTMVEVQEGDNVKTYKYHVNHSSLPEVVTVEYGLHTLHYLFSFLSEPLPRMPQYSVVGYMDNVPIISYNSESDRAGPRATWMEKITDKEPRYWEESRETFQEVKMTLNDSLRNLMEEKNQSSGLHVFQGMLGCELREDGSVKWFERFAYDGSNYNSNMDPATATEDGGISKELSDCIKSLKKLLQYGEESLQRKVAPRTMVSRRKSSHRTFLIGYAYGFYPRDIEVKWVRDGAEVPWESNELLPNPDGTFQVRTTVEVQEGDDVTTYEYHVNHISLPVTVIVEYDPPGRSGRGRLLLLVASLMTAGLGAVLILWEALKSFFTSEDRAQRSDEAQTSGGGNEGVEMVPLQRDTTSDTAGPSTGSEARSSTCKGSQEAVAMTG